MLEFGCQPWFLRQKVKVSNDGRRKWSAKESRATLEKWKDEKSIEAWNAWNAWNRRPGRFDICRCFCWNYPQLTFSKSMQRTSVAEKPSIAMLRFGR